MAFDQLAKNLLKSTQKPTNDKDQLAIELSDAGFSRREVLEKFQTLYDDPETEPAVRRQILDTMTKIHKLTDDDEKRALPQIIIQVKGDNTRVATMLNPKLTAATSGEV